jgi:hypothetical protein
LAKTAVFAVSSSIESSDPELTLLAGGESELPGTTPLVLGRLRALVFEVLDVRLRATAGPAGAAGSHHTDASRPAGSAHVEPRGQR